MCPCLFRFLEATCVPWPLSWQHGDLRSPPHISLTLPPPSLLTKTAVITRDTPGQFRTVSRALAQSPLPPHATPGSVSVPRFWELRCGHGGGGARGVVLPSTGSVSQPPFMLFLSSPARPWTQGFPHTPTSTRFIFTITLEARPGSQMRKQGKVNLLAEGP